MVDIKKDIKRTYFLPPSIDVEVKVRAAREGVKQSDIVRMALERYLYSQDEKKSRTRT
jgi:hypothetical protein